MDHIGRIVYMYTLFKSCNAQANSCKEELPWRLRHAIATSHIAVRCNHLATSSNLLCRGNEGRESKDSLALVPSFLQTYAIKVCAVVVYSEASIIIYRCVYSPRQNFDSAGGWKVSN